MDEFEKVVRQILDEQYSNLPDGLSGNEDCGQMSAWYVLSAIGIYTVTPGLDYYTIGTPLFEKTTINLENGNAFCITAKNVSDNNIYIQSASLNGGEFNQSFIRHQTIMNGGALVFEIGSKPSDWGNKSIPPSEIKENKIVPVPFFEAASQTFVDEMTIELGSAVSGNIYYSLNGTKEKKYDGPITMTKDVTISCRTFKEGKWSKEVTANYYKIHNKKSIILQSQYANQYAAAGDKTLIDHLRGGENYRTGNWQGFRENLIATVDLGVAKEISTISLGCLQDIRSWIFFPTKIEILTSTDNETYTRLSSITNTFSDTIEGTFTKAIPTKSQRVPLPQIVTEPGPADGASIQLAYGLLGQLSTPPLPL